MEDFGVPRTHSPEPFKPEDYVTLSSPSPSTSATATTTATKQATGSVSRTGTGRRTNASITYPPSSTQQTNHLQENADAPKPSVPVSTVPAIPPPRYWHPKLTVYRLLVILTTLGFGVSKAVLSYQGRTIVPITLEWFFGTGVFLLFFALDTYQPHTNNFKWFFDLDLNYALYARISSALFNIPNPPFYSTQELERRQSLIDNTRPPIRGYDLLVTVCTAVVGMSKSILAYRGMGTAVTSVDWVGGVVIGLALYWLGLYESNPIGLMPYLFTTDYSSDIKENITLSTPILILPHLAVIALASWWTYKCTTWAIFLSHIFDGIENQEGRIENQDGRMMMYVMNKIVLPCFTVSYMCACATGIGVGICCVGVVLLSRFRFGRYWESSSRILSLTAPLFRLTSFYLFFAFSVFACIAIMIPVTPMLFDIAHEEPVLYLSLVLVLCGTAIMGVGLVWLLRGVWGEVGGLVRWVMRRVRAGYFGVVGGRARARGVSMGV
ncbi:hypothetical protein BDQ17DRAFT_1539559 [Cyathus striatus]|nr:hypothetical protein BDQ17DRAFT_1539559 [Cyathus striatus]